LKEYNYLPYFCDCGCGGICNHGKRFISGHNGRVYNGFKDRHHSEKTRKHWSEIRKGKNTGARSVEVKLKISKSLMGHEVSEESRKKCSSTRKANKKVIKMPDGFGAKVAERNRKRKRKYTVIWAGFDCRRLPRLIKKKVKRLILRLCKCGCMITTQHTFVQGHNNVGKKVRACSDARKKKASVSNLGKHSENTTKYWSDPIWKNKQINRMIEGGVKTHHFYSKKNDKTLYYHSTWELAAFQILEQLILVKSYDRCRFSIDYYYEDKEHKYIPDILITYSDNSQQVVEVKPKFRLADPRLLAKHTSAETYLKSKGISFSIWNEDNLFPTA